MKLSLKLDSVLEGLEMGETAKLEDAEFDYLYKMCQPEEMKWKLKHNDILGFLEYLEEVKLQKD